MNIYLVRNPDGQYLHVKWGAVVTWVEQQQASVYTNHEDAHTVGMHTFQWDDDANEEFEIVHLVATAKVDKSHYPKTVDGAVIELGKTYYHFDRWGVFSVYANELTTQFTPGGDIEYLRIREDYRYEKEAAWVYSDDLYSTEPLAWVAWKEAQ